VTRGLAVTPLTDITTWLRGRALEIVLLVLGAALGFGAQQVVRDLPAGLFIVVERQYGYGDLVHISAVGFEGPRAPSRRSPCGPPACAP
jgi:hypothetical protein